MRLPASPENNLKEPEEFEAGLWKIAANVYARVWQQAVSDGFGVSA